MFWMVISSVLWAEKPKLVVHKSTFGYESILIHPIPFLMGSSTGDLDEDPHEVNLTRSFYMGRTEVTVEFWKEIMGSDPWNRAETECIRMSDGDRPDHHSPVYCVDWFEVARFANQLSDWERLEQCYHFEDNQFIFSKGTECLGYRLPTEAEWEFTASAPSILQKNPQLELVVLQEKLQKNKKPSKEEKKKEKELEEAVSRFIRVKEEKTWIYSGGNDVRRLGWYIENAEMQSQRTALLEPNRFGLYDLSGNLWEWCHDWYASYPLGSQIDPLGPKQGTHRVLRGGSFSSPSRDTRVHNRFRRYPTMKSDQIGFRLVRTAPSMPKIQKTR